MFLVLFYLVLFRLLRFWSRFQKFITFPTYKHDLEIISSVFLTKVYSAPNSEVVQSAFESIYKFQLTGTAVRGVYSVLMELSNVLRMTVYLLCIQK